VTGAVRRAAPPRGPAARSVTVRGPAAATPRGTPPAVVVVAPAPPRDEPASVERAPRLAFALPRDHPLATRRNIAPAPDDPHAAARRTGGMLAPTGLAPGHPATGTHRAAEAPGDAIASYDAAPDAATAAPAPERPAVDGGAAPAPATPPPTDTTAAAAASAPPTEAPAPAPAPAPDAVAPADAPAGPATPAG
jgi:hypothetical protein